MSKKLRTDHIQGEIIHEYDGIEEADNHLPRWWLWTFYGAIIFSIGYWFYYHEYHMGPTTPEAYARAMAARAAGGEVDETALVALAQDPATVASGRETYSTTCAACHGAEAQGEIGPNLTDPNWLHGGAPLDIYRAVRGGIRAEQARIQGSAGMPEWGPQLGERRVQAVVAYLMSLRGTNVSGRPPEGEVYDPNAPAEPRPEHAAEHAAEHGVEHGAEHAAAGGTPN